MKIVTFALGDERPRPGILLDGEVADLSPQGFSETAEVIASGEIPSGGTRIPLHQVRILAPILSPPRIFCIGLNYRDHAVESNMQIPAVPTVFMKLASAIVGPGHHIVLPMNSKQPDYEAEFAVVIGRERRFGVVLAGQQT